MNYFDLFDLPVTLKVNGAELRKKFFELSKQSHPDYYINESDEEQQLALEKYAAVNVAFKTLSNTEATIKYVLQQKGLLQDDEKYALPPHFLMEMLELNEALEEAQAAGSEEARTQVKKQIELTEQEIYEPVSSLINDFNNETTTEKELAAVKEYYFKKKYLQRLAVQLA